MVEYAVVHHQTGRAAAGGQPCPPPPYRPRSLVVSAEVHPTRNQSVKPTGREALWPFQRNLESKRKASLLLIRTLAISG